ncbi:MAG: SDR family NAD(P)-dependent oxidoreductase [Deltaproteobacteria bacterium]|nr:MAG: SDR family NAD(P)-dependent oxidoreductase [Deltaproteobacteria bacterium]
MGKWQDHVVWITGGGTGLGKHMALRFAREGATVAISGRREPKLVAVAEAIRAAGGTAHVLVCDVTDEARIDAALAELDARFGRLDVVVANAGVSIAGPVEELTMAEWRRQMDVNVCAVAVTCGRAVPYLEKTGGRLALVGSVAAMVHFAKAAPYQASKAAVAALGGSLSVELASRGISCTTIHPGFVESEIYKVDNEGRIREDRKDPRPAALVWEAEPAARVMCDAIYKRKREFVFTGHGRFGWFMGRHFPALVSQITRRVQNNVSKR